LDGNSFGPDAALPYRRVLMAEGHVRAVEGLAVHFKGLMV